MSEIYRADAGSAARFRFRRDVIRQGSNLSNGPGRITDGFCLRIPRREAIEALDRISGVGVQRGGS